MLERRRAHVVLLVVVAAGSRLRLNGTRESNTRRRQRESGGQQRTCAGGGSAAAASLSPWPLPPPFSPPARAGPPKPLTRAPRVSAASASPSTASRAARFAPSCRCILRPIGSISAAARACDRYLAPRPSLQGGRVSGALFAHAPAPAERAPCGPLRLVALGLVAPVKHGVILLIVVRRSGQPRAHNSKRLPVRHDLHGCGGVGRAPRRRHARLPRAAGEQARETRSCGAARTASPPSGTPRGVTRRRSSAHEAVRGGVRLACHPAARAGAAAAERRVVQRLTGRHAAGRDAGLGARRGLVAHRPRRLHRGPPCCRGAVADGV